VQEGIVVDQHDTYLDRKLATQDLINSTGLNIPVYMALATNGGTTLVPALLLAISSILMGPFS
jgi:hypothetical protein